MLPALVGLAWSALPTLSELADRHGTDKSLHRGHGYVNLYGMLLDPHRDSVRNVTEIGVLYGQSVTMWAEYFANAHIWGLDIKLHPDAVRRASSVPRIHLFETNAQLVETPTQLQLVPESMDLVIEDASHSHAGTHAIAEAFWPLVKPGGLYVIEDVNAGGDKRGKYSHVGDRPGFASVAHNASGMLREIYLNNDVFYADTMLGIDVKHSRFAQEQMQKRWMHDVVNHNWHAVVIRKRAKA